MLQIWNKVLVEHAGAMPPMLGALALLAGLIILLLGWRLSYLIAALDFSIFGAVVGATLVLDGEARWLSGALGAIAFGALAIWMGRYGVMVVSGVIAGIAAILLTEVVGLAWPAIVVAAVAAFGCTIAVCWIVCDETAAVMTAIQGGLLTGFGLLGTLANSGAIWQEMRPLLFQSPLAMGLFIVAPILVGVFFQLASIQTEGSLTR